MPEAGSGPQDVPPRRPRGLLPLALVDLFVPSLKVGTMSGGVGAVGGLAAGIMKDVHPALFATASGIQCFILGSSFWLSRSVVVREWGGEEALTPRDRIKASAIGGGFAGTVGGLLRGPQNIIPGAICFAIFGTVGQGIANRRQQWKEAKTGVSNEKSGWFSSKWSPLRKLSDDEYEDFMSEKMLKVEAQIALIDDKMAELLEEDRAKRAAGGQLGALEASRDGQGGGGKKMASQEVETARKTGW